MKDYSRSYPEFSLCGLNCVLCPRFHTEGSSRCPGCGGPGFLEKHPACSIITCSSKHGNLEFCHECEEFPCEKYRTPLEKDSFITWKNFLTDMDRAKKNLPEYITELMEKKALLEGLISDFNDGRMKSFFCLAVNLIPLKDLKTVVGVIRKQGDRLSDLKEKAKLARKLFLESAEFLGIRIELRK